MLHWNVIRIVALVSYNFSTVWVESCIEGKWEFAFSEVTYISLYQNVNEGKLTFIAVRETSEEKKDWTGKIELFSQTHTFSQKLGKGSQLKECYQAATSVLHPQLLNDLTPKTVKSLRYCSITDSVASKFFYQLEQRYKIFEQWVQNVPLFFQYFKTFQVVKYQWISDFTKKLLSPKEQSIW